ncbi:MAG: sulfur carrier protein ThiS [Pseudomonadota bacterium]
MIINGQTLTVAPGSLEQLLAEAGFESDSVATAVNGTFVSKAERNKHMMADGDQIEVLTARQGG